MSGREEKWAGCEGQDEASVPDANVTEANVSESSECGLPRTAALLRAKSRRSEVGEW